MIWVIILLNNLLHKILWLLISDSKLIKHKIKSLTEINVKIDHFSSYQ